MATTFASKTQLKFEPSAKIDMGAVAVAYTTPGAWRHTLGGLSLINGVKAELKYRMERDPGAGTVNFTVRVKTAAGVILHEESQSLTAGATLNNAAQIDVGAVSGGSPLLVEVEVTTADAGTTATLDALIEYESPVIISGC